MATKILAVILSVSLILIVPVRSSFAQDPVEDLKACETLLDEQVNEVEALRAALEIAKVDKATLEEIIADLELKLAEYEKTNEGDGDISIADLLEIIPGFLKLPKQQRALIVTITLALVALGISYIPAPSGSP